MLDTTHLNSSETVAPVQPGGNKIFIAFVLWTLDGMGGSEHVVFDIVQRLDKSKFEVLVVSFKDGFARSLYENRGVKVAVVSKSKRFDWHFIRRLRNLFLDNKIQLVNAHHFSPLLYSYLATCFTEVKLAYTEHSVWQFQELNARMKILSNFLLWRTDAIIAISQKLLQYYRDNPCVSRNKIHLIKNGIDLSHFKKVLDRNTKRELGLGTDDILIGTVANLRPEKNHKVLISAFALLPNKLPNVHLLFVGQDYMDGEVQRFAATFACASRIHFLGPLGDVTDILNVLDVVCLPSVHEGLPLTILEAMACEVPVVGSNVMGINEVIIHEENGLLFEANNEAMLAEVLERMLSDRALRDRLKKSGLDYVRKYYSLDDKMKDYQNLFHLLCVTNNNGL